MPLDRHVIVNHRSEFIEGIAPSFGAKSLKDFLLARQAVRAQRGQDFLAAIHDAPVSRSNALEIMRLELIQ